MANNYIDPQKFLEAMLQYEKERDASDDPDNYPPTDYISKSLILIAENHVRSSNFIKNGTDVDALIGEAIFDMVKTLKNFNSKKSKNPFAYFSQCAYYAYLRVLMKEQKEFKKKCKLIQSNSFESIGVIEELEKHESSEIKETVSKLQQYLDFDLTPVKEDKKKKPRAPLYLQNRTQEEKDQVKINAVKRNTKVVEAEPEDLVGAMSKGKKFLNLIPAMTPEKANDLAWEEKNSK